MKLKYLLSVILLSLSISVNAETVLKFSIEEFNNTLMEEFNGENIFQSKMSILYNYVLVTTNKDFNINKSKLNIKELLKFSKKNISPVNMEDKYKELYDDIILYFLILSDSNNVDKDVKKIENLLQKIKLNVSTLGL